MSLQFLMMKLFFCFLLLFRFDKGQGLVTFYLPLIMNDGLAGFSSVILRLLLYSSEFCASFELCSQSQAWMTEQPLAVNSERLLHQSLACIFLFPVFDSFLQFAKSLQKDSFIQPQLVIFILWHIFIKIDSAVVVLLLFIFIELVSFDFEVGRQGVNGPTCKIIF